MESPLNVRLRSLVQVSQRRLAAVLDSTAGNASSRDLHFHQSLIKPFERVCGISWLRQHGIDKIFKFDPKINVTNLNRVYLIPSCLIALKHVADQINSFVTSLGKESRITIIVVPKVLNVYEALIEEEGLSGIVELKSFQWELMYTDEGLLSLELPFLFKNVYVNRDTTILGSVSSSLWTLFQIFGRPKMFLSVGKHSSSVVEMYDIFHSTYDNKLENNDSEFGVALIVDRDQDYASNLLTPATYSGLLYEIFNIKCNELDLDVANTKYKQGRLNLAKDEEKPSNKKPVKMILDSSADPIYSEIKYLHFSSVFPILSNKAKELNADGTKMTNIQLEQMKHVISTQLQRVITDKKFLSNHILACETIVNTLSEKFEDLQIAEKSLLYNKNRKSNVTYLEESVCTDVNMYTSLKLMCLLTLTQGITYEEYSNLTTKYLHAFGYKYLYVFQNLINAGLIIPPTNTKIQLGLSIDISSISDKLPKWQTNFRTNANRLKQLPSESEDIALKEPTCPSFVFNGSYIPLIAALSKILLSVDNLNEFLNKLSLVDVKIGGPIIDDLRTNIDELGDRLSALDGTDLDVGCKDLKSVTNHLKTVDAKSHLFPLKPRSLLIFVVGGVTQAEIAACHLVEKLTGGQIVIASDYIIAGEDIIQSAM